MLPTENSCRDVTVQNIVPDGVLNQNQINHSDRIYTVMDSQGNQIIHTIDQNNIISSEDHHVHGLSSSLPLIQVVC